MTSPRIRHLLTATVALAVASVASAADDPPIGRGVGAKVADFPIADVLGASTPKAPATLYGYAGRKAALIVFGGVDCPVGNLYMPRVVEVAKRYRDRGVVVLLVNANAHESASQVADHARAAGVDFPVLKDEKNAIADQLLATRTCEALVLDGSAVLRYRGAIDDQYGAGTRKDAPRKNYVVDAIEAILAGSPVETAATPVVGCPIERADAPTLATPSRRVRAPSADFNRAKDESEGGEAPGVGPVTFAGDVAPILQAKCQSCHRPKEVAPFSLLSYDDARRWAASIAQVVEDRRMPPWHADPRIGHFDNDRSLTRAERATLLAWVEQGAPLGDVSKLPPPRAFSDGWSVGTPDVVFSTPEQTIQATGTVAYQNFRVPTKFAEDRWVDVIEARPGNRAVVHHIVVYLLSKDGGPPEHLGGYAPGDLPSVYEPGTAKRIPAGAELMLQLHYTPIGKIQTDTSVVGFTFAKTPTTRRAITRGISQTKFEISPGEGDREVRSGMTFRKDAHLLSFMPHMHLRGKDFRYTAVYPDGRREDLLSVPAYNFAFQSYYRLAEPKAMPQGTRIECVAHFDNSESNPANPDPRATVHWGEQTWEEMMIGYVDYTYDEPITPPAGAAEKSK